MEPNTTNLPVTSSVQDTSVQTERLLVASRLATDLAGAELDRLRYGALCTTSARSASQARSSASPAP